MLKINSIVVEFSSEIKYEFGKAPPEQRCICNEASKDIWVLHQRLLISYLRDTKVAFCERVFVFCEVVPDMQPP